jgi:hypothetical protein
MTRAIACRLLLASLLFGPWVGCKSDSSAPDRGSGVATSIRLVEGTPLSGVAGKELPLPLVVEVTDAAGKVVPNQIVNFRVIAGGGSVFAGSGLTNAAGRVQDRWTLGTHVSEPQVLEARAVDNDTGAPLVFASFTATALPDVMASMIIVSGNEQTGQAGAPLANPLVVLVADHYGNPVPGISVAWTVEDGNGSLEASATATDGSGRASNRWTLGPVATAQHVRADSESLSVRFSTAGIGGVPAFLTKVSGDQQSALQGTAVLAPPTVKVTDSLGSPMAGIAVQFTVTAGGGTVLASSANTDASGLASCGGWTLGDSPGPNAMTASSQGLNPVVFSAAATDAISISGGVSPGPSTLVGDSFVVYARVTAANPITSVTGSIGVAGVTFAYSPVEVCGSRGCSTITTWNGTMSGAGMFGPVTVTLTAHDSLGHQASASVAVVVDRPPVVTATLPAPETLARPLIEVASSCRDDDPDGCAELTVFASLGYFDGYLSQALAESDCRDGSPPWHESTRVAQGASSISQAIDLSAFEGQVANLCFIGIDSSGQKAAGVFRRVYVESSSKLGLVATVPGMVLDAAGTRILFRDGSGPTYRLRLHDWATGETQEVASHDLGGFYPWLWFGYVTDRGVLHALSPAGSSGYTAYEWQDGVETVVGLLNSNFLPDMIQVAGGYALIAEDARGLVRRDVNSGLDVVISPDAQGGNVASNGDVVYVGGPWGEVFRYRSGTTTKLSSEPAGVVAQNSSPLTDGNIVTYWKSGILTINDGTGEAFVIPSSLGDGYLLAGGWVTYMRGNSLGGEDVWRHGLAGEEFVATGGSTWAGAEALAPNGTVILHVGVPVEFVGGGNRSTARLFRFISGAPLEELGSTLGTVVHRDGRFLVLIGASVLEVLP